MNTCRRLTPQEWEDLGRPEGYPTQEACDDGCGVCCSNVCSSCSWTGYGEKVETGGGWDGELPFHAQPSVGAWYHSTLWVFYPDNRPPGNTGNDATVSGNWQLKPEADAILTGANWRWRQLNESCVEIIEPGKYKYARYFKWFLLKCQDGTPVDVTNQTVNQEDGFITSRMTFTFSIPQCTLSIGKALDFSFTTIQNSDGVIGDCDGVSAGWNVSQAKSQTNFNSFLSCTQRTCTDISKTDCEAGGGTWNPGLTCAQVNCNG